MDLGAKYMIDNKFVGQGEDRKTMITMMPMTTTSMPRTTTMRMRCPQGL